jgi:hypothetical protein
MRSLCVDNGAFAFRMKDCPMSLDPHWLKIKLRPWRPALILALACLSTGCTPPMTFEAYAVPLSPLPELAPTRIPDTGLNWKMRQYLEVSADSEGPDFADRLRVFKISCGTGCLEYRLIDRFTGEVLQGDYVTNGGVEHRRDSRLLIVHRSQGFGLPQYVDYLVWDGSRLRRVMTAMRERGPD